MHRAGLSHGVLRAPGQVPRFSTPGGHAMIRYAAFDRSATPGLVAFYEQMLVDCPPDVRATVGLSMSEMELHHALPRINVPALVMAGARDRLTPPSHAHRIAGELPQLERLIILPETGHMGPIERPAEVTDALCELFAVANGGAAEADAAASKPASGAAA